MDLENFINNNREDFDNEVPDLKVWANIDKKLAQKEQSKVVPFFNIRRIAAACLLLLAGGLFGFYMSGSGSKSTIGQKQFSPEFVEAESFYKNQYNEKVARLANYEIDHEFSDDLQQFEAIMEELKIELAQVPKNNRERLITTIIQNYQTKIEVLERILERLESIDSDNTNSKKNEVNI